MTSLIKTLESFNRKERHILWEQATGTGRKVELSDQFRGLLSTAVDLSIPADALVLVDYHLNWLYASLLVHSSSLGASAAVHEIPEGRAGRAQKKRRPYEHNQEDVDLLVAFENGEKVTILLVEAKGFTAWSTAQIESKLDRLDVLVHDAAPGDDVDLRLVLASFAKWQKLDVDWGRWAAPGEAQPAHVVLTKPEDRLVVEECQADGTRQQGGNFIHLRA